MHRCVHLDDSPSGFDLAESVVQVGGIRALEVNHFVGRKDLALLARCAVQISLDELVFARHNLDILARHRPELHWSIEFRIHHGMDVRVSREFRIQHTQNRCVVSVLIRVHLRQQLKQRMRVRHDFVVVRVLRDFAHREHARSLRTVASEKGFCLSRSLASVPEFVASAAVLHIETQRS